MKPTENGTGYERKQLHQSDAAVALGKWLPLPSDQDKIPKAAELKESGGQFYFRVSKTHTPSLEEIMKGVPAQAGLQELILQLPDWLHQPHHPNFRLLAELGAVLQPPVMLDGSLQGIQDFLTQLFTISYQNNAAAKSKINLNILEAVHDSHVLNHILEHSTAPQHGLEQSKLICPTGTISLNSGDFDSSERIALLVLALLEPNQAGPVSKFVKFLYANDLASPDIPLESIRNPIQLLVTRAMTTNQELRENEKLIAAAQENSMMPDFKEIGINRSVSNIPAQTVVLALDRYDFKQQRFNPQIEKSFRDIKNWMQFQEFKVDVTAQQTPQVQANQHQTELFVAELTELRRQRVQQNKATDWKMLATALCKFHIEDITFQELDRMMLGLNSIFSQDVDALTHQQIALIMALELVIVSAPQGDQSLSEIPLKQGILQLALELHSYGLYFLNITIPSSHPARILHGAIIGGVFNPCAVHTLPQLQGLQLSLNAAALSPTIPMTVPFGISLPPLTGLSGVGSVLGSNALNIGALLAFGGVGLSSVLINQGAGTTQKSSGKIVANTGNSATSRATSTKKTGQVSVKAGNYSLDAEIQPPSKSVKSLSKPVPQTQSKADELQQPLTDTSQKGSPKTISATDNSFKEKGDASPQKKSVREKDVVKLKKAKVTSKKTQFTTNVPAPKTSISSASRVSLPAEKLQAPAIKPVIEPKVSKGRNLDPSSPPFKPKKRQVGSGEILQSKTRMIVSRNKSGKVEQITVHKSSKTETKSTKVSTSISKNRTGIVSRATPNSTVQVLKTEQRSSVSVTKFASPEKLQTVKTSQVELSLPKKEEQATHKPAVNLARLLVGVMLKNAALVLESFKTAYQDTQPDVVVAKLARKRPEYKQKGKRSVKKTKKTKQASSAPKSSVSSDTQSDQVVQAAVLTLPENKAVTVSDSFSMANEVKRWAHEAWQHPKFIQRQYGLAA